MADFKKYLKEAELSRTLDPVLENDGLNRETLLKEAGVSQKEIDNFMTKIRSYNKEFQEYTKSAFNNINNLSENANFLENSYNAKSKIEKAFRGNEHFIPEFSKLKEDFTKIGLDHSEIELLHAKFMILNDEFCDLLLQSEEFTSSFKGNLQNKNISNKNLNPNNTEDLKTLLFSSTATILRGKDVQVTNILKVADTDPMSKANQNKTILSKMLDDTVIRPPKFSSTNSRTKATDSAKETIKQHNKQLKKPYTEACDKYLEYLESKLDKLFESHNISKYRVSIDLNNAEKIGTIKGYEQENIRDFVTKKSELLKEYNPIKDKIIAVAKLKATAENENTTLKDVKEQFSNETKEIISKHRHHIPIISKFVKTKGEKIFDKIKNTREKEPSPSLDDDYQESSTLSPK